MDETRDQKNAGVEARSSEPAGEAPREGVEDARLAYEPPKLLKKRSIARVTLFSGGGVAAGGLTASG